MEVEHESHTEISAEEWCEKAHGCAAAIAWFWISIVILGAAIVSIKVIQALNAAGAL